MKERWMLEYPFRPGPLSWWTVVLRSDDGNYRNLIVTGANEDDAIAAACNIELAPKRSVVKVEAYHETN